MFYIATFIINAPDLIQIKKTITTEHKKKNIPELSLCSLVV